MTITLLTRTVRAPRSLHWWEWGKLLGASGLIILLALFLFGATAPPIVVAVVMHTGSIHHVWA